MSGKIAELAFDLHAGLSSLQVSEFDDLHTIGMAVTLAIHIKGLAEIDYEVLRKVSDHYFSIPSVALEKVCRTLAEVGFVRLVEKGRKIERVIPDVPIFDEVYDKIGTYAQSELTLNSHEQIILHLLTELQDAPRNREALFNKIGADKRLFDRCMTIGRERGILSEHQARGRTIIISPHYFADNLQGLADAAVASGSGAIKSALDKVKNNQGWPLSLVTAQQEIGGIKLSPTELALITKLSSEGVIKPPTVKFGKKSESFVFTPRPGGGRLNAANENL